MPLFDAGAAGVWLGEVESEGPIVGWHGGDTATTAERDGIEALVWTSRATTFSRSFEVSGTAAGIADAVLPNRSLYVYRNQFPSLDYVSPYSTHACKDRVRR